MEQLEQRWHDLMRQLNAPARYVILLWREIILAYSEKSRYYHNLSHLENLFNQADQFKNQIIDFETLQLSIWYHDIIYQCLRKDNEEKSALFAKYRMEAIGYPRKKLVKCYHQIIATKNHQPHPEADSDTLWLLDFDLSILGKSWEEYLKYAQQIRKEYAVFPSFLYKKGRKKLLHQFLEKEKLFHTETYYNLFEANARNNIRKELKLL